MECKLIVDVGVFADDAVLLVKYGDMRDQQRGWFLPDDLLQNLEHPDDGARRVLREQLGLEGLSVHLTHIESFSGRDKSWHLAFHYRADLPAQPEVSPGGGVQEHRWFDLSALPARSEVAHGGWALDVIEEMSSRSDIPHRMA